MTKEEMAQFIEIDHPVTFNSVRVDFDTEQHTVGFFDKFDDAEQLKEANQWRFIPNNLANEYQDSKSIQYSIVIDGDEVSKLTLL